MRAIGRARDVILPRRSLGKVYASSIAARLIRELAPQEFASIVVLVDEHDKTLASKLTMRLPKWQRVRTLVRRKTDAAAPPNLELCDTVEWSTYEDLIGLLQMASPPAAIVDATTSTDRLRLFMKTFWVLPKGGVFICVAPNEGWSESVRAAGEPVPSKTAAANKRRAELAASYQFVSSDHKLHVLRKIRPHHFVLRHSEVERVLQGRYGDDWGDVIVRRGGYVYESRANVVMHGEPAPREKPSLVTVPALAVRRYHEVVCRQQELMSRDNLLLPDTFRHWQSRTLFHRQISQATAEFGRIRFSARQAKIRYEAGEFFALDSAFPNHFGHLMTETISRIWGWRIAYAQNPDLRPVMTLLPKAVGFSSFQARILNALDVPTDRILWVTKEEAVQVDSLVAAMPQFENPHYADLGIAETWAALKEGLRESSSGDSPEKIFLSRREGSQRYCTNTAEIEAFVAALGFAVIYPETLPIQEQSRLFANARVIAGFAGSALFNMMFNPATKVVVLASRSYVAANEYLIASVGGNEIHYFWAPALLDQPGSGFSRDAYRSDFTFPLDEHRAALNAVLK